MCTLHHFVVYLVQEPNNHFLVVFGPSFGGKITVFGRFVTSFGSNAKDCASGAPARAQTPVTNPPQRYKSDPPLSKLTKPPLIQASPVAGCVGKLPPLVQKTPNLVVLHALAKPPLIQGCATHWWTGVPPIGGRCATLWWNGCPLWWNGCPCGGMAVPPVVGRLCPHWWDGCVLTGGTAVSSLVVGRLCPHWWWDGCTSIGGGTAVHPLVVRLYIHWWYGCTAVSAVPQYRLYRSTGCTTVVDAPPWLMHRVGCPCWMSVLDVWPCWMSGRGCGFVLVLQS